MRLDREYLPATREQRQELVLLHGWGSNREVWRPLLAELRPWVGVTLVNLPGCAPALAADGTMQLGDVLESVLAAAPARAVYLGWSLGGQLAAELAFHHPRRVTALVTLCSNPRFVAADDWPGVEPSVFSRFRAGSEADPRATLKRFASLQVQGAGQPRVLLRRLQELTPGTPGGELVHGLDWLAGLDQRSMLPHLSRPQLHLLAERDALVPPNLEQALRTLLQKQSRAAVQVLPGACHLAPLDSAPAVASRVLEFLDSQGVLEEPDGHSDEIAKSDVAISFSRAASGYDSVAALQREVGQGLLARLDGFQASPSRVLDLGCGTGFFRPALVARYPGAGYIGLDLAPGMVEFARARAGSDGYWLVADGESLPLATASIDLVFSSLTIQWCPHPRQLFAELARVLKPGGRCLFTTLGPDTLGELRAAWAAVDCHQHVNTFLPPADLAAAAATIPDIALRLATRRHCMHYEQVKDLLAELKTLGAHNMNRSRPAGLTSRRSLLGMFRAYETRRADGLLPATYDVISGELERL